MTTTHILTAVATALAIATAAPRAHHASAAEFDGNKPVKLVGTITKVEWINPHTWIYISVKGPDGSVVEWKVQGGSPNGLLRRGVKRAALLPGTVIAVEGARAKDGTPKVNGRRVTLADGQALSFDFAPQ
ncbi:MAG: hypothetical protein FJ317_04120 [SAR202 cluster bacterium]|nr:hypothetical protein [SAR202 cluster bacterium]